MKELLKLKILIRIEEVCIVYSNQAHNANNAYNQDKTVAGTIPINRLANSPDK